MFWFPSTAMRGDPMRGEGGLATLVAPRSLVGNKSQEAIDWDHSIFFSSAALPFSSAALRFSSAFPVSFF